MANASWIDSAYIMITLYRNATDYSTVYHLTLLLLDKYSLFGFFYRTLSKTSQKNRQKILHLQKTQTLTSRRVPAYGKSAN